MTGIFGGMMKGLWLLAAIFSDRRSVARRSVAAVLVAMFFLTGCYVHKPVAVTAGATQQPVTGAVLSVVTLQAKEITFDDPGGSLAGGAVHGKVKGVATDIPMDQVQRLWLRQISVGRTIGLTAAMIVGTVVVVVGIAAALKQSCPFVYSWDGDKYVFDAEPYGGAIARGLQKDDYSELGQLKEQDGKYKLRMTNEVDETQMTNLTELWVVDHPAGTRVVPDTTGKLHTIGTPQELLAASDDKGNDLLPWLRSTDKLVWEPPSVPDKTGSLASEIVLTFPKPKDAKQVKLVMNAATGLWGSYMIKKMVELRGKDVGKFYLAVNHSGSARKKLADWELREGLYALNVEVEEPTGWEVRGVIPGTGPFISKDRILPLDVSRVQGETLRVRIHPPAGFWALNSFAADYTADQAISTRTVKPETALDASGRDVRPQLVGANGKYLAMPNVGDAVEISFVAPAKKEGAERTVILHSRGYYKLHIRTTGEPDKRTLEAFEKQPGSAAKFAADQFGQWQTARLQAQ
jgi:hypothetical protein